MASALTVLGEALLAYKGIKTLYRSSKFSKIDQAVKAGKGISRFNGKPANNVNKFSKGSSVSIKDSLIGGVAAGVGMEVVSSLVDVVFDDDENIKSDDSSNGGSSDADSSESTLLQVLDVGNKHQEALTSAIIMQTAVKSHNDEVANALRAEVINSKQNEKNYELSVSSYLAQITVQQYSSFIRYQSKYYHHWIQELSHGDYDGYIPSPPVFNHNYTKGRIFTNEDLNFLSRQMSTELNYFRSFYDDYMHWSSVYPERFSKLLEPIFYGDFITESKTLNVPKATINVEASTPAPTVNVDMQTVADAVTTLQDKIHPQSREDFYSKQNIIADYKTTPKEIKDLDGNVLTTATPLDIKTTEAVSTARKHTDENNFELDEEDFDMWDSLPTMAFLDYIGYSSVDDLSQS